MARAITAATGLGRCWPPANQSMSSAIQKSVSVWVAIRYSSQIINSPSGRAVRPAAARRCNISSFFGRAVSSGAKIGAAGSSVGASKFIVVKLGNGLSVAVALSSVLSKFSGRGKSAASAKVLSASGALAGAGVFVMCDVSNADTGGRIPPRRVRINAPRISSGIYCGSSMCSGSLCCPFGAGAGSGAGSGAGGANARTMNPGRGIVNSGFFVRIIIAVVAAYIGTAANTINPNTKPPNPCRCECAS